MTMKMLKMISKRKLIFSDELNSDSLENTKVIVELANIRLNSRLKYQNRCW